MNTIMMFLELFDVYAMVKMHLMLTRLCHNWQTLSDCVLECLYLANCDGTPPQRLYDSHRRTQVTIGMPAELFLLNAGLSVCVWHTFFPHYAQWLSAEQSMHIVVCQGCKACCEWPA